MLHYHPTSSRQAAALLRRLRELPGVAATAPESVRRTWLDTFDWRLFAAGWVLEHDQRNGDGVLRLRRYRGDATSGSIALREPPRMTRDLPPGPFRDRVAAMTGVRALLAQACGEARIRGARLRAGEGKLVVRVWMESWRFPGDAGTPDCRMHRLRIVPLRGYEPFSAPLRRALEEMGEAPPAATMDPLDSALAVRNRHPGDYSSRCRVEVPAAARADVALRAALLHLLSIAEQNEHGVCADIDSEFLHDYRVALRRSRSLLGELKHTLAPAVRQRFSADLAWLGSLSGPLRDCDVHLLDLQQRIPDAAADADALAPFVDWRRQQRARLHAALAAALRGSRYRGWKRRWRRFLESAVPPRPRARDALRPIAEVAGERVLRLYRRALARGGIITAASPPEALHELRIVCKRLRYLLEVFQGVWDAQSVDLLIASLKRVQQCLGDFQDLAVQIAALRQFGDDPALSGACSAATRAAVARLSADLEERQQQARVGFTEAFGEFARPRVAAAMGKFVGGSGTPRP